MMNARPGIKAVHQALIFCVFTVLAGNALGAQQNPPTFGNGTSTVRGQILLPDGNVPTITIRFDLDGANGYHDLRYTDSNGRIIIPNLPNEITFTILVRSDEVNWGDTEFKFIPGMNPVARFYLNPLPRTKLIKPPEYKPSAEVQSLHDRGIAAFQSSNPDEAEALLRQAMKADPKYVAAFNDLGVMLMRRRKYAEAEQVYLEGLQTNSKSATLLENLGTDQVHAGKYEEAITTLRAALHIQPARGEAHLQLGAALVETGRYTEAEPELLAAKFDVGADATGLQLYFGKLYASTGNFARAIEAFTAYLKLAPPDSPSIPAIRAAMSRMQDALIKRNGK